MRKLTIYSKNGKTIAVYVQTSKHWYKLDIVPADDVLGEIINRISDGCALKDEIPDRWEGWEDDDEELRESDLI